jgi:hypothetical protein
MGIFKREVKSRDVDLVTRLASSILNRLTSKKSEKILTENSRLIEINNFVRQIISDPKFKKDLIDIFTNLLQKSGIKVENSNLKFLESLKVEVTTENVMASYSPAKNTISLNFNYFDGLELNPKMLKVIILYLLIHEFFHSQGKNKGFNLIRFIIGWLIQTKVIVVPVFSIFTTISESGFSKKPFLGKDKFNGLNEGMTDLLAHVFTRIILEQNGERDLLDELEKYKKRIGFYGYYLHNGNYTRYISILINVVNKVAEKQGFDRKVIFQAFVKAYFTGDDIHDSRTKRLITETFGENFFKKLKLLNLRNKNADEEVKSFLKEYFPDLDDRITPEKFDEICGYFK